MEELILQLRDSLSKTERLGKLESVEQQRRSREALLTATNLTRAWINDLDQVKDLVKKESFIAYIIQKYWALKFQGTRSHALFPGRFSKKCLNHTITSLAESIAFSAHNLPVVEACYYIGNIYTLTLSEESRASAGAYYTPPNIVSKIVDDVEKDSIDFRVDRCIDPACGSGIFLVEMVTRISNEHVLNSDEVIRLINRNIKGLELDPIAAWMAQIFVECSVADHLVNSRLKIASIVETCNSLHSGLKYSGKFDLVIGNPPYGKISLDKVMRDLYSRSLYGHANLYSLFMDLSLRMAKNGGLVALITPTSFLAGEYFKSLRKVYNEECEFIGFDFVSSRRGVFQDVLQETVISVFRKVDYQRKNIKKTRISELYSFIDETGKFVKEERLIGFIDCSKFGDMPWMLPRRKEQLVLINAALKCTDRLNKWGYEVKTGQLVWNRHKDQLTNNNKSGSLPLIWADSILPGGKFKLLSTKKHHSPFLQIRPGQEFLITDTECILMQRTTSKEQDRRIQSAILPKKYFRGGVVVENHVNIIKANNSRIDLVVLDKIIRTSIVDQIFRCISGSVAVSAYELEAIPLPSIDKVKALSKQIKEAETEEQLEKLVKRLYML